MCNTSRYLMCTILQVTWDGISINGMVEITYLSIYPSIDLSIYQSIYMYICIYICKPG